ncbi:MAG: NAD(P)H-dependent oxidoreductase subunit E [Methanotrichaceae archaeon]
MRPMRESSDKQKPVKSIAEKEGALIPLLQKAQSSLGYISPEAVEEISGALEISESEVYGVATFYAEFKLFRPGEHNIKVCMGTSCYLKGGRRLLDHLTRRLGIRAGSTTKDGKFSLETVACLGCCSKSPVMSVDGIIYGDLSLSQADSILSRLRSKA